MLAMCTAINAARNKSWIAATPNVGFLHFVTIKDLFGHNDV